MELNPTVTHGAQSQPYVEISTFGKRRSIRFGILVLALMMWQETRAFMQDRTELNSVELASREPSERNFKEVAGGLKHAIESSQRQFDATMERSAATFETVTGYIRNPVVNMGQDGISGDVTGWKVLTGLAMFWGRLPVPLAGLGEANGTATLPSPLQASEPGQTTVHLEAESPRTCQKRLSRWSLLDWQRMLTL